MRNADDGYTRTEEQYRIVFRLETLGDVAAVFDSLEAAQVYARDGWMAGLDADEYLIEHRTVTTITTRWAEVQHSASGQEVTP